jgi:hypothetical protein
MLGGKARLGAVGLMRLGLQTPPRWFHQAVTLEQDVLDLAQRHRMSSITVSRMISGELFK